MNPPIKLSGYRIDATGLRDRFFPRYFGKWPDAQSVWITRGQSNGRYFTSLHFSFASRKKPVRIERCDGKKAFQALRFARKASPPSFKLEGSYALDLLAAGQAIEDAKRNDLNSPAQNDLIEAVFLLRCFEYSKARKKVRKLLDQGGEIELQARTVLLESFLEEDEMADAEIEYLTIRQKFPGAWEPQRIWTMHRVHAKGPNEGDDQLILETLDACPPSHRCVDLKLSLAYCYACFDRKEEALQ